MLQHEKRLLWKAGFCSALTLGIERHVVIIAGFHPLWVDTSVLPTPISTYSQRFFTLQRFQWMLHWLQYKRQHRAWGFPLLDRPQVTLFKSSVSPDWWPNIVCHLWSHALNQLFHLASVKLFEQRQRSLMISNSLSSDNVTLLRDSGNCSPSVLKVCYKTFVSLLTQVGSASTIYWWQIHSQQKIFSCIDEGYTPPWEPWLKITAIRCEPLVLLPSKYAIEAESLSKSPRPWLEADKFSLS